MKSFRQCFKILILTVYFACICSAGLQAASGDFDFDDRLTYDIFFSIAEDRQSVVEHVSIEGFTEIAGKKFLVVKSRGLKLSEEEGYILFESIVAILPDRNFKVKKSSSHNY